MKTTNPSQISWRGLQPIRLNPDHSHGLSIDVCERLDIGDEALLTRIDDNEDRYVSAGELRRAQKNPASALLLDDEVAALEPLTGIIQPWQVTLSARDRIGEGPDKPFVVVTEKQIADAMMVEKIVGNFVPVETRHPGLRLDDIKDKKVRKLAERLSRHSENDERGLTAATLRRWRGRLPTKGDRELYQPLVRCWLDQVKEVPASTSAQRVMRLQNQYFKINTADLPFEIGYQVGIKNDINGKKVVGEPVIRIEEGTIVVVDGKKIIQESIVLDDELRLLGKGRLTVFRDGQAPQQIEINVDRLKSDLPNRREREIENAGAFSIQTSDDVVLPYTSPGHKGISAGKYGSGAIEARVYDNGIIEVITPDGKVDMNYETATTHMPRGPWRRGSDRRAIKAVLEGTKLIVTVTQQTDASRGHERYLQWVETGEIERYELSLTSNYRTDVKWS